MNDIKYTLRQLAKTPGFAAVAILTLALGIGGCTAIYSIVHAVILKPLPFHEADQLVWLQNDLDGDTLSHWAMRADNLTDYQQQTDSLQSLAAYNAFSILGSTTLTGSGDPQRVQRFQVSQNFLEVLGVPPFLGRGFLPEDTAPEAARVAMISHALWKNSFGGRQDIIGQPLTYNSSFSRRERSVTVIGVLPPKTELDLIFATEQPVSLLTPINVTDFVGSGNMLYGIGRLKPGQSITQAQQELKVIDDRLRTQYPDRTRGFGFKAKATLLDDRIRGEFRPAFALLTGAVLCVLLIACVNLSNLLLTRAHSRRHEFSMRAALGASRWHLLRQTLVESLTLALAGGLLGIALAYLITRFITQIEAFDVPLLATASIDAKALLVSLGIGILAAALCSVLPAIHLFRQSPSSVLRSSGTRTGSDKGSARVRRVLVVSEIALACMLLVGAGLLGRSLLNVLKVDLGFQPQQTFALRAASQRNFETPAEEVAFYQSLVEKVATVPGVASAGLSDTLPLGFGRLSNVIVPGRVVDREEDVHAYKRLVDRHYLSTMGISLVRGRYFDERDSSDGQPALIISETMARQFWPNEAPLGKAATIEEVEYTVIGVVADVPHQLESSPQPDFYMDMRQVNGRLSPYLIVRGNRTPEALLSGVRSTVKGFDPSMATNEFTTMESIVDQAIAPRKLITGILSTFSSFALLLAAIGLYGTIAYSVSQRTREIGIRIAVGARRSNLLRMVVGEGLAMAAIGVLCGLLGAWFIARILQNQLFGVTTNDILTYVTASLTLGLVVLAACAVPAIRAARIDPIHALRAN